MGKCRAFGEQCSGLLNRSRNGGLLRNGAGQNLSPRRFGSTLESRGMV
jgi:hypothetical protein